MKVKNNAIKKSRLELTLLDNECIALYKLSEIITFFVIPIL